MPKINRAKMYAGRHGASFTITVLVVLLIALVVAGLLLAFNQNVGDAALGVVTTWINSLGSVSP